MVVDRSDLPVSCSTQRRQTSQLYRLDSQLQCSTTPTSASVSVSIRIDAELRGFNSHLLSRLSPRQLLRCTLVAGVNPLSTFCTHGITSFTVHSGGWCKPSQHLRPMALHISHCIVCEPSQHLLYP